MTQTLPEPRPSFLRRWLRPIVIGVVLLVANVVLFLLIPPDFGRRMGRFGYLGAFIVAAVANATVIIPVPYFPLLARLAQSLDFPLVVLAGALGSAVGESAGFFVGRSGKEAASDTRLYRWVQRQLTHPWRAFLALFLLSAPPNPAFDVAGILAGAMGLPFWMFFLAVFLGRIIRIGLVTYFGLLIAPQ